MADGQDAGLGSANLLSHRQIPGSLVQVRLPVAGVPDPSLPLSAPALLQSGYRLDLVLQMPRQQSPRCSWMQWSLRHFLTARSRLTPAQLTHLGSLVYLALPSVGWGLLTWCFTENFCDGVQTGGQSSHASPTLALLCSLPPSFKVLAAMISPRPAFGPLVMRCLEFDPFARQWTPPASISPSIEFASFHTPCTV